MTKTLQKRANDLPSIPTVVVAAENEVSVEGALAAAKAGHIAPIFVGNSKITQGIAEQLGISEELMKYEFINITDHTEATLKSIEIVERGDAFAIMKGSLHTNELFSPIIRSSLKTGRRFSHCYAFEVEGLDRPLVLTDAALNIEPDLAVKKDIAQNAVDFCKGLGVEPRIAFLSALEDVTPRMPDTADARALADMANAGEFGDGVVADGPMAFDNAFSAELAARKGISSPVAGNATVLMVPTLVAGNVSAKIIAHMVPTKCAPGGFVLGAKVPVIVTSRSDGPEERMAACAYAKLWAHTMLSSELASANAA